jgi:hypothetical protein
MAYSIDEAFGNVADADMWEEAVAVAAGFLTPTLIRNVAEGRTNVDVYDEVYGLAVMALAAYSPMYSGSLALGGGVYTLDTLMTRFDLKQTVTGENL